MVYDLIQILWSVLSACFGFAAECFESVGIPLVTAITIMVLVSSILRLFTAKFVGQQINIGRDRKAVSDARYARETAKRERAETERLRIQSGKEII